MVVIPLVTLRIKEIRREGAVRLTTEDVKVGVILASDFPQTDEDVELCEAFLAALSTPEGKEMWLRVSLRVTCAGTIEAYEKPDDLAAKELGKSRVLAALYFALGAMWSANGKRFPIFNSNIASSKTGSGPYNEMGWRVLGLESEFVNKLRELLEDLSYASRKQALLLIESAFEAFEADRAIDSELNGRIMAEDVEDWLRKEG